MKKYYKKYFLNLPCTPYSSMPNELLYYYFQCVKAGRNDSKFTIGKYHINTMEIIKLFRVNIFMSVAEFLCLMIWLFCNEVHFESLVSSGGFPKKPTAKLGILH